MEKQELINAIMAVLGREKHFALIRSTHATEEMAKDIVKMLEEHAESAENLFDFDADETEQVMAVPLKWIQGQDRKSYSDDQDRKSYSVE